MYLCIFLDFLAQTQMNAAFGYHVCMYACREGLVYWRIKYIVTVGALLALMLRFANASSRLTSGARAMSVNAVLVTLHFFTSAGNCSKVTNIPVSQWRRSES